MHIEQAGLAGAYRITLPHSTDLRGNFTKTFHKPTFEAAGLPFELRESYFSFSAKNVIRGMHFQLPPYDHSKIVFCPSGAILDVIIDLRVDSTTYGAYYSALLSDENHVAMYIPEGFAHGFKSLTDNAITYYLVSTEYNREADTGILWSSFGFNWEVDEPIISARDQSFVSFTDFKSNFTI